MNDLSSVWGDPYNYKEINIYPVIMSDCINFYQWVSCLMYEKNKSKEIKILKMSYLHFLFYIATKAKDENGNSYHFIIHNLESLLKLVFRADEIGYKVENDIKLFINDFEIDENDFEDIRQIILKQNLIRIDENILDDEVQQAIQEAREFMANKTRSATLEEQIVSYHCLSGVPYDIIKNFTVYQFSKGIERFQIIKNYEVYGSLMAEHGSSKDIQYFLAHIEEKGLYDDVVMSKEDLDKTTAEFKK